jgi:hypothetical protein
LLLLMLMLMHRRPGVLPMAVPCTSHQKVVGPPQGHTLWWHLSATEHPILRLRRLPACLQWVRATPIAPPACSRICVRARWARGSAQPSPAAGCREPGGAGDIWQQHCCQRGRYLPAGTASRRCLLSKRPSCPAFEELSSHPLSLSAFPPSPCRPQRPPLRCCRSSPL